MKTTLRVFVLFFGIGIWQTSASIAETSQEAAHSESQRSDGRASGSGIATLVGSSGTILRSTDGGDTWTSQVSGYEYGLAAVSFADANTGTTVGGQTILHTTDGGDNWAFASVPAFLDGCIAGPVSLSSVFLANADIGFAVGSCPGPRGSSQQAILRTTDGGNTWTQVARGVPPSNWLAAIAAADATKAIAVGHFDHRGPPFLGVHSMITTDGGIQWVFVPVSPALVPQLRALAHPTRDTATAVGVVLSGGAILRTDDGGSTWTRQYSSPAILYAVSSPDDQIAVAVGDVGTILRTTDAGETWTEQLSGTLERLYGVSFKDGDNGIAVGSGGIILRTTDGGETWIPRVWNDTVTFTGVSFLPRDTATR